jgi:hypothetical protein
MDAWPISAEDFEEFESISRRYAEAVMAGDWMVCDSLARETYETMVKWEEKYGEHPFILEHKADFAEEPEEKRKLYTRALELAVANGLETITIRIWLARLLLEEFGDASSAMQMLSDGQHEVFEADQDEDWIRDYGELVEECRKRLNVNED